MNVRFVLIATMFLLVMVLGAFACNDNPPAAYTYTIPADRFGPTGGPAENPTDGDEETDGDSPQLPDGDTEEQQPPLVLDCLTRVTDSGFGDSMNKYAMSMAVYDDRLFVGTYNGEGGSFVRQRPDYTMGGELWAYDGEDWELIIEGGFGNPNNYAISTLVQYDGKLYAGTANDEDGAEVWVSQDGDYWSMVATNGLTYEGNKAVSSAAVFDGELYMGSRNDDDGAQVMVFVDNHFSAVGKEGLSNRTNQSITSMTVFRGGLHVGTSGLSAAELYYYDGDDFSRIVGFSSDWSFPFGHIGILSMAQFDTSFLYLGTSNLINGFGLFRSRDARRFSQLESDGFGDRSQIYGWSLASFGDAIFVGTLNQGGLVDAFGEGGELFRSTDGENFEKLIGRDGLWAGPGIEDPHNYGFPTMAVYRDKLYIGTAQCYFCSGRRGLQIWEADDPNCQPEAVEVD